MFEDEAPEDRADEDALDRQSVRSIPLAPEQIAEVMDETAVRRDFAAMQHMLASAHKESVEISTGGPASLRYESQVLIRHVRIIVPHWRDVIALQASALSAADDPDAPFVERVYKEIRQTFWAVAMQYDLTVNYDRWHQIKVLLNGFRKLYRSTNELARLVDKAAQRHANQIPKPANWRSGYGAAEARLQCALIQTTAAALSGAIVCALRDLKGQRDEGEAETGNAARMKRFRERRRQGMIAQVPFSLNREDAPILRAIGFLPPGEPTKEQLSAAIEAFFSFAILGRTDLGLTWAMREDSQAGRLKGLGAPEEDDD